MLSAIWSTAQSITSWVEVAHCLNEHLPPMNRHASSRKHLARVRPLHRVESTEIRWERAAMLPQQSCRGRPEDQASEAGPCHPLPAPLSQEFRTTRWSQGSSLPSCAHEIVK